MNAHRHAALPRLLIIDPNRLCRSTVAGVCRSLELAQVHQVASIALGLQVLREHTVDAVLLSLADPQPALDLLEQLREARFRTASDVPVAVTATEVDAEAVQRLKALGIRRLLLQPYKIRDIVQTVETIAHGLPLAA